MSKVFVTSDLHLQHDKDFIYKARGFNSIQEHDEAIINRWNEVVSEDDEVFVLGDVYFGDAKTAIEKIERLNGAICWLTGNHDSYTKIQAIEWNCSIRKIVPYSFTAAMYFPLKKHKYLFSHYPTMMGNGDEKIWVYNLCGHTHTTDPWLHWNYGCYHVEMDAHNCYPVSLDEITKQIKEKKYEKA